MVVFAVGLIQFWAHRNDMNADGISYIEMAEDAIRNGWHALVNGYWSPLYPFLISVVLRIFHPRPEWEFTVVHGLNFALYLMNFACFEVFLGALIRVRNMPQKVASGSVWISPATLRIWGCVFFLWASQYWVTPIWITPDLLVAALSYLTVAILLSIYRGQGSWVMFALLGVTTGLGFLAKTPMFLLAFVFLACGFLAARSQRASLARPIFAVLIFGGVAVCLIVPLSRAKGRWTFGDSGRINYAEFVNGVPKYLFWEGEPQGTGVPVHPPRKLLASPALYEFATPIPGSYPLWRDPSYWYEGVRPHFEWTGQLKALYRTASSYLRIISVTGAIYIAFLVLVFVVKPSKGWMSGTTANRLIWIPSCAALAMYALVHVEPRFVGGFGLMLLMMVFARVRLLEVQKQAKMRQFAVVFSPMIAVAFSLIGNVKDVIVPKHFEDWDVARGLQEMGISPGSEVGYVGDALNEYWAHLAGIRIVVETPKKEQDQLVTASEAKKLEVLAKFSDAGVVAILTKSAAVAHSMEWWQPIPQTSFYVVRLRRLLP